MSSLERTIRLKTNFAVPGKKEEGYQLPEDGNTLRHLLVHLGREIRFDFFDPASGELETELEILLNGKDFLFFAQGLDTRLKAGDDVDITLLPLGGG